MRVHSLAAVAACAVSSMIVAAAGADVAPLEVTGFNADMVINNGSANYADSVTATMDGGPGVEGWTWNEAGTYPIWNGSEAVSTTVGGLTSGVQTSMTGSGTFQFADFSGNNALNLQDATGLEGTLSLVNPGMFTEIAVYGAAGYDDKDVEVTLNFSDGSSTLYDIGTNPLGLDEYDGDDVGIAQDWFSNNDSQALFVGQRLSNKSEEGYTIVFGQQSDDIHIYESLLGLSAEDQTKTLESIDFVNYDGDRLAILAVSGAAVVVPEPATASLLGLGSLGLLCRRRRSA